MVPELASTGPIAGLFLKYLIIIVPYVVHWFVADRRTQSQSASRECCSISTRMDEWCFYTGSSRRPKGRLRKIYIWHDETKRSMRGRNEGKKKEWSRRAYRLDFRQFSGRRRHPGGSRGDCDQACDLMADHGSPAEKEEIKAAR